MINIRKDASLLQSAASDGRSDVTVLSCWKDIAEFLGKGVRTVQRYEQELGLPIRRPKQARKATVLAVPSEISQWLRSQELSDGEANKGEIEIADLVQQVDNLEAENRELHAQLRVLARKSA